MTTDCLETLINQTEELIQAGKYEQAIAVFQEIRQYKPNNASTLAAYTNTLILIENYDRVAEVFESSIPNGFVPLNRKINTLSTYIKALRVKSQYKELLKIFLKSWLKVNLYNSRALYIYLKDVIRAGKNDRDKAFEVYESWSQIEPENFNILYSYAEGLVYIKNHEEACKIFEKFLNLCPDHLSARLSYIRILSESKKYTKAICVIEEIRQRNPEDLLIHFAYLDIILNLNQEDIVLETIESLFYSNPKYIVNKLLCFCKERLNNHQNDNPVDLFRIFLLIQPTNENEIAINAFIHALMTYSEFLMDFKYYDYALDCLDRLLQFCPKNIAALYMYGKAFLAKKMYIEAFAAFEKYLIINPNDVITLCTYGKVLAHIGRYPKAFELFESALKFDPDDVITLTQYGEVLGLSGHYDKCFDILQNVIIIQPNNVVALKKYAVFLIKIQDYEQVVKILKKLLEIEPKNIDALNKYGMVLAKLRRFEESYKIYERSLRLQTSDYILFKCAELLEETGKYNKAILHLQKIDTSRLQQYHANVIRVSLGRLHYRINSLDKGKEYFDAAIAYSDDKERTLLYSARSILATNPHSETAVEMLRQIPKDSPRYTQVSEMLTLNLSEEDYFEMVKKDTETELSDTEMLNRAMYHKIANEISILKGIAYRILRNPNNEDTLLNGIIQDIEDVFEEVNKRRAAQKSEIETISHDGYESILAVISKTAHDISDFVNNQLAIIESKTRRAIRKLQSNDIYNAQFEKLLTQLELTQTALSDLKAINEGITIKNHRFKVKKLFEKWETTPQIDDAQIFLNIRNGNSEFKGDEEKIKSALNELVENSLKHNAHQQALTIYITVQDIVNPVGIRGMRIPGEQKYLFIEFADNGKGISEDKKDWIFQPLKTTSKEGKGSGLGLFIIRKTLTKMNGYIRETGRDGAKFEIYIPYIEGDIL